MMEQPGMLARASDRHQTDRDRDPELAVTVVAEFRRPPARREA
jgi:hypothetical protein